jgi:phage gp29-like protein
MFALYRDMILGYSHLQSEWMKRKAVITGEPHAIIPRNKNNAEDVVAAKVIQEMIDHCDNWLDGLTHLLDATLYPVSVVEKIFEPISSIDEAEFEYPIRYRLRFLREVHYSLLCFKLPYTSTQAVMPFERNAIGYSNSIGANDALEYDVDDWEPELRFYNTGDNGRIDFGLSNIYAPDRMRHIVHRGDMLSKSIRDNFGGPMRAILFWWLLATKDRDWFGVFMQKYGSPFIMGKADAQNKDTVDFLRNAFALATQIGGLIIDKRAEAELIQAASTDGANAHKTLIGVCNDEVSKIVVGQVLSSSPKNTGLGSGVADLHSEVRQDIERFDQKKLSETLKRQLFRPYLRINGYRGAPPEILWGGEKEYDAQSLSDSVNKFYLGGLEPTDEGIHVIGQRVGYELRRREMPEPAAAKPKPNN